MRGKIILAILSLILFVSFNAKSQVTFDIYDVKHPCTGPAFSDGGFSIRITGGVEDFNVVVLGPATFFNESGRKLNDELHFSGKVAGDFTIIVQDANNVQTITPLKLEDIVIPISVSLNTSNDNTDCNTPNGSITLNASGGSGALSFAWTASNGFTSNTQDISNLSGGDYTIEVSDDNSNCSTIFGPITISDPSPNDRSMLNADPTYVCTGDDATIVLGNSENGVDYELLRNGGAFAPAITSVGDGNDLNITIPAGQVVNGDVITILASEASCTPVLMTGSTTINVPSITINSISSTGNTQCTPAYDGTITYSFNGIVDPTPQLTWTGPGGQVVVTTTAAGSISNSIDGDWSVTIVDDVTNCPFTFVNIINVADNTNSPNLSVSAANINLSCNGDANGAGFFEATGGTAPYSFTLNSNTTGATLAQVSNRFEFSDAGAGVIEVFVTDDNGCTSTSEIITVIEPAPIVPVLSSPDPTTICEGDNVNLQVAITGGTGPYTVVYNDGTADQTVLAYTSGDNIPVTPIRPGAAPFEQTYTLVSVTGAGTCSVSPLGQSVTFTFGNPETASISTTTANICEGTAASINVTIVGGTGPYTVTYNDGVNPDVVVNNYVNGDPIVVTPTVGATTTYTLVAVEDNNGCSSAALGTSTAAITVSDAPDDVVMATTTPSICEGEPGSISFTITGGVGPFTVTYEVEGANQVLNGYVSGTAVVVAPTTKPTTTYTLVSVVDETTTCPFVGVPSVPSVDITVNDGITAAVLSSPDPTTICEGDNVNLQVAITGGTGPYTVVYNDGTADQTVLAYTSGDNIPITPIRPGAAPFEQTYTLVSVTGASTCSLSPVGELVTFTFGNPETASISTTTANICEGTAASINVTIVGGTGPYTVTYNDGVNPDVVVNNYVNGDPIVVTPTVGATTTYTLVAVEDNNGCSSAALGTSTAAITVSDAPDDVVIATTTPSLCLGDVGSINFTVTGGVGPFTIVYNDGISNQILTNYVSGTSTNVLPTTEPTTTYSIVSVTDESTTCSFIGLPSIPSIDIDVTTPPRSGFALNPTVCGDETTFPLTTTLLAGTFDAGGTWTDEGGNAGASFDGTNFDPSHPDAGVGVYSFKYTVTGTAPCADAETIVTINVVNAFDAGISNPNAAACATDNAYDLLAQLGGTPQNGGVWAFVATDLGGLDVNTGIWDISASTAVVGNAYDLSYTLSGGTCAPVTSIVTVTINAGPNPGVATDLTICKSEGTIDLTNQLDGSQDPGTWTDVNGTGALTGSNLDLSNVNIIAGNTYEFVYTASLAGCADATTSVFITISDEITAVETITDASCNASDGSITLVVAGGVAPYTFDWRDNTNAQVGTNQDLLNQPAGDYTVTITDNNGTCSFVDTYTIGQPAGFTVTGVTTDITTCGGNEGSVSLTIVPAAATYTFDWTGPGGFTSNTMDIANLTMAGTYDVRVTETGSGCFVDESFVINNTAGGFTVTETITDITNCGAAEGSIILDVVGTGPFTYAWTFDVDPTVIATTQNISGISTPGDYHVTVTSGGCNQTFDYTINGPTPFTINETVNDITTCGGSDGSITTTIPDGSGNYEYTWVYPNGTIVNGIGAAFDNITNLSLAGFYTLDVLDLTTGCTVNEVYEITQPITFTVDPFVVTDISTCGGADGAITGNVTGGSGNFGFSWEFPDGSNSTDLNLTGLSLPGNYTITILDNATNCSYAEVVVLDAPINFDLALGVTQITTCGGNDGAIDLEVTNGSGNFSYSWTGPNGFTANTEDISNLSDVGDYTVVVNDLTSGCSDTRTATITEPADFTIAGSTNNISSCGGNDGAIQLTITGGSGDFSFSWTGPNGFTANTQDIAGLSDSGLYTSIVTDNISGCSVSRDFFVGQPLGFLVFGFRSNISTCNGSEGSVSLLVFPFSIYAYSWTGPNGFVASTQNISGLTVAGTYSVTITTLLQIVKELGPLLSV